MRLTAFLFLLVLSSHCLASAGKVIHLIGSNSYLVRGGKHIPLELDLELELEDKVYSAESIVVLYLLPSSQLSLSKNSEIQISQALLAEGEELTKSESIIDLIKGLIRLQVIKESDLEIQQTVRTKEVSFGVRGTDFEVKMGEDEVDLDVFEGEVEVTSPFVATFVPYYVKESEGFRYGRKKRLFSKRAFSPRFREAHFRKKEEIRERWQKRRKKIRQKKTGRRQRALRRK